MIFDPVSHKSHMLPQSAICGLWEIDKFNTTNPTHPYIGCGVVGMWEIALNPSCLIQWRSRRFGQFTGSTAQRSPTKQNHAGKDPTPTACTAFTATPGNLLNLHCPMHSVTHKKGVI